jgi:hypothetical protein
MWTTLEGQYAMNEFGRAYIIGLIDLQPTIYIWGKISAEYAQV